MASKFNTIQLRSNWKYAIVKIRLKYASKHRFSTVQPVRQKIFPVKILTFGTMKVNVEYGDDAVDVDDVDDDVAAHDADEQIMMTVMTMTMMMV